MRVLIGIMYCGEGEYADCLQAIRDQDWPLIDTFAIENLPNKAAHDLLYRTFTESAGDVDLFMKVDADMVINRPDFVSEIVRWFSNHGEADQFSIRVWDWFTQRNIDGLHTFRSTVRWPVRNDMVRTDRGVQLNGIRVADDGHFDGYVTHGGSPTEIQAFRFGVHKAWKSIVGFEKGGQRQHWARQHFYNISRLWHHFSTTRDNRVLWACYGAELMLNGFWKSRDFDYNDASVHRTFADANIESPAVRERRARALWRSNRLFSRIALKVFQYDCNQLASSLIPKTRSFRKRFSHLV